MNESYRLGEQSIIAYLQRLANGVSTAELDVAALPAELRAVGEQLQRRMPSCNKSASCLSATPISIRSPTWATATDSTVTSSNSGAKATPSPAPILTSTISSIAMIGLATPKAIAIF